VETHPAPGDVDGSFPHPTPHGPIPDYLEPFVVDQDIHRYTAQDQAVWRFVLLQLQDHLGRVAHPAYARGLADSGISVEHIPSVEQMNRALSQFGWRAVCVDGFIPPRAFQAFQALRILPIAAEIRSARQLPYTPAPDIIHEAAGHAPILVDTRYAEYVQASGAVASKAFANPRDARVDRAVRRLSELKEQLAPDAAETRVAEQELESAVLSLGAPSEAARLARLYWWTAEYGLVGSPSDYRLYGAGLLSSLGESHFCQRPEVRKLPLSARCTEVGYDITRPQPQLFVAEDFEHLHSVLAEVRGTLALERGGLYAARIAEQSRELASVHFPGGAEVIGTLDTLAGDEQGLLLGFAPGAALVAQGRVLERVTGEFRVIAGPLRDGCNPRALAASASRDAKSRITLQYACGAELSGVLTPAGGADSAWIRLDQCRFDFPGQAPWLSSGPLTCLLAERVVTAHAGSSCAEVSPLDPVIGPARARLRVPRLRETSPEQTRLNQLYARVRRMSKHLSPFDLAGLSQIHRELDESYPEEWLLRWNALECLVHHGMANDNLSFELRARLDGLEQHFGGQHPIAMGLRYLSARGSTPPSRRVLP
jgi:phenylalanine-4-hydroxylase